MNILKRRAKILLICLLCALPAIAPAQEAGDDSPSSPPIIRNAPLRPGGGPVAPGPARENPPAEVPQPSDAGMAGQFQGLVKDGIEALGKWDLAAADEVARKIEEAGTQDEPDSRMFLYKLAFFHGDYAKALKIMESFDSSQMGPSELKMLERVRNLADVMKGAIELESEHFIVRVTPGPDEILAKDTLRTLEAAYAVLTKDLEVKPTSKVVAEIFPSFKAFNWATGLSEKDVETSGTVAVCKFSRLMVTTPRALVYGYTWRDTLAHEFVHYLVFLRSGYNVPIWLHEGIAKYEEERWRGNEGGELTPYSESLLASALKSGDLVTFEQMEPTFAKLPSPAHGALAFAEVSCAVKYLVQRGGFPLVVKLVDKLAEDRDYKKAIREVLGEPYETFYRKWIAYMKSQQLKRIKGAEPGIIKIKKGDSNPEDSEEAFGDRKESPVYKYSRIGDLLQGQGRYSAALIEYRKALDLEPDSAHLLNKTAHMFIMVGDVDGAEPLLKKVDALSPMAFPSTYKRLGLIYIAKKDWTNARKFLEISADINPFDPELQTLLVKVYNELGETELESETQRKISILMSPRPPETVQ